MLPVSIITGFLGSGKTTLLNRLLLHESLKNSLVIINEFGEVGIDHLLVSAPAENMRLLASGCVCCEVKGDLVETLTDVSVKRARGEIPAYDRVLIETTGLADPVPVVQTIVTDTELSQLATQGEVTKQIAVSDIVLLSKTDLVDADALAEVEAAVRRINGGAELLKAVRGDVHPDALFGRTAPDGAARLADLERWLAAEKSGRGSGRSYTPHAADINTYTLYHEAPVTASGVATWLSMLASFRGPQLLRVKGLINVAGAPYIIHAVQTVIHEPVELQSWPSDDKRTRIVFIVRGLERAALERTFAAFAMPESLGADALQIDPAAYARFVEAAKQFI
jgi:G3E family GTPase